MAVEPVPAPSAIALRPSSGDTAFLAALGAGESLDATVIARLADGSLRLALADALFAQGADGTSMDEAGKSSGTAEAAGGRAASAPDGSGVFRHGRQTVTSLPADSLATNLPQRAADARRPALLDLPASSGLKPGDQVRLTILHPAPELSVGVHLRAPVNAAARENTATGQGAPLTDDTSLARRTGGPLRLPDAAGPDGVTAPVRPRDIVTLSPGATLLVESITSDEAPAAANLPELTPEGRAAVAALIPRAAAGQGSLAPLLVNAEAVLRLPAAAVLPSPVRDALRMLISAGVDATTLDAASLRQAVAQSGPFFEAALAAAIRKAINAAVPADMQAAMDDGAPPAPSSQPGQGARVLPSSGADGGEGRNQTRTAQPASVATGDRNTRTAVVATPARLPAVSLPAGQPIGAAVPYGLPEPVPLAADLKNVLLVLKTTLAGYLGPGVPLALPDERPAPPRRGAAPVGQKAERASILADTPPREAARVLAAETDGALDRVRLLQTAALPEEHRSTARADNPTPDRLLEIPLRLPGETPVLALAIGPDGRAPVAGQPRGWHMRLSLDLGDAGTIDGYVAVRGPHASVVLSANRQETVQSMRDHLASLRDALSLAHFDIDFLDVRASTPAPPPSVRSGAFLDKSS